MQVEQSMHLDGRLVATKPGPGKQLEAQVDGGRVQRVEALIQFHAHGVLGVHRPRDANQYLREIGEDAPVVGFVGVGQCGAGDAAAETEVVELAAHSAQTGFDVAQTVAVSQLRKCHRQVLVPTGKAALSGISVVVRHAAAELAIGKEADQLGEDGPAFVHPSLLPLRQRPVFRLDAVQIAANLNRMQIAAPE